MAAPRRRQLPVPVTVAITDLAVALLCATLDIASVDRDHGWRWGGHDPAWLVPAYCLLGASTLLLRRRHPTGVLVATWVYAWGRLVIHGVFPIFVPLAAIQAFVARRSRRSGIAATLAFVPPFVVNVLDSHEVHEREYNSVLLISVCAALLLAAAYGLGRVERGHRRGIVLAEQRFEAATEDALAAERRRLARELHDSLGHAITAMSLQAAGARAVARAAGSACDPRVVQALDAIEGSGSGAMRELHRLLGVLRSEGDVAVPTHSAPGTADLPGLVDSARSGGLRVHLDVGPGVDLDPSVDYAVYRVVQEALANAMRHDGAGAVVDVSVGADDRRVVAEVVSRTPATRTPAEPVTPSGGFGLSGLRERVVLIGGTLAAGPADGGFRTRATIPRRPAVH